MSSNFGKVLSFYFISKQENIIYIRYIECIQWVLKDITKKRENIKITTPSLS